MRCSSGDVAVVPTRPGESLNYAESVAFRIFRDDVVGVGRLAVSVDLTRPERFQPVVLRALLICI